MSGGRRVVIALILFASALLVSGKAYAQYGYGSVPSKAIRIDKLVIKPGTSDYVDNLSSADPKFSPSQDVWFKLIVKNTSQVKLNDVEVREILPAYVDFVSGPGNFDTNSRVLTFDAGDFEVDQEKEYFIKTRFVSQDKLPQDKSVVCVVNKVEAKNMDVFDEDTAQFCVEKQVLGAKEVPAAGPELGLLFFASQFGLLGTGIFLKNRAK